MRWVVFRGHGFSLLEKPTLRGLQTRAVPAGVNGPPLQTTIEIVKARYSTIAKHYVSEGNTRRLLRESEDDETPQRAFFASEEAHREPAESVVYFRSGMLCRSLYQLREFKTTMFTKRSFFIILTMLFLD